MKKFLKLLFRLFCIIIGSCLCGIGTICFIKTSGIATSGLTGLVNVINYIHPVPIGICVAVLNVPLLIIAAFKFKPRFVLATFLGIVLSSAAIDLADLFLSGYLPFTDDMLLSAVAGGALNGAGYGLIMRSGSSTGGSDIITKLIHRKFKHLKGGLINIIIGFIICVFYFAVTRNVEGVLYTVVVIIVDGLMYDLVLYGTSDSKTVYIITNKSEEMIKNIFDRLEVGATILDGTGAYTGDERQIILCVVRNSAFPVLKETVRYTDGAAFMIVTKSSEVFGEGYESYEAERL